MKDAKTEKTTGIQRHIKKDKDTEAEGDIGRQTKRARQYM